MQFWRFRAFLHFCGTESRSPTFSCRFYSQLIACLRYRTIVDRLLGMRLVPARRLVKRDVSYEFMNRQMVWHAFTVRSLLHISSFMLFTAFFSTGIPDLLTSNTSSSSTSPCSQHHTHRYHSSLDHLAEYLAQESYRLAWVGNCSRC